MSRYQNVVLLNPPAGASIDTNGVITWTPSESDGPGTNVITTIVNDGSASATNSFTVVVTELNSAPTLASIGQQTIAELTTLTVTNTATDSDLPSNILSYQLLNPPAGANIDTNGVITWTPSESDGPGTNVITTVVNDGSASATNSFTIIVTEVNSAPTLASIGQQTVAELTTLTVTNTATDSDLPANTRSPKSWRCRQSRFIARFSPKTRSRPPLPITRRSMANPLPPDVTSANALTAGGFAWQ